MPSAIQHAVHSYHDYQLKFRVTKHELSLTQPMTMNNEYDPSNIRGWWKAIKGKRLPVLRVNKLTFSFPLFVAKN